MGQDILYKNVNFPAGKEQCASACTLRVVTMEAVSRLEWLGLTRTLRVVAVVVVARLDARGGYSSARTMRAHWEVQLSLHNSYYISAAPQILFIYMAVALCAAGGLIIKVSHRSGQYTLLKRSCYSEVR